MLGMTRASIRRTGAGQMLTVRGRITSSGQSLDHVQFMTENYVVTELGRLTILHCPALGGRFVVDTIQRMLRRVEVTSQAVQIQHLREMVGSVSVHRDPEPIELHGFTCHRYRLCNDSTKIVVSAEAFCAHVEAVGRTALQQERAFEAQLHPFALPLDPDELVVASTTRTFSNGFQHVQSYRHSSLADQIEQIDTLEDLLRFPIAD
jgi:hypothetical protein